MGELWLGEGSKVVIEAGFNGFVGAKTVRFSRGQFDFVVESLDGSGGKGPFGAKPVENQLAMVAQSSSHLLHRFELAPHRSCTPLVEELPRPTRTHVFPEPLSNLPAASEHAPTADCISTTPPI